jgi:MFS family permease
MLCQVVCGTQYLNVSSFFPLFVKANYGEEVISTTMVSLCMCSFEFAGVIMSPINSRSLSIIGRKNALTLGFTIMFCSCAGLGMIAKIPTSNWKTFYAIACFTRFMQGYGDSLVLTSSFSMVASNFSEERDKYFGYIEAASGLGLVIGPPIGSMIYGRFGYQWAFYSTSIFVFINVIICMFFVPNKLNLNHESNVSKRQTLVDQHNSYHDVI